MTTEEFIELTQAAKEGRNLEFKRSTPWVESEFKAKIVKSILAFSNVRDGGAIVIGIERQPDSSYKFAGMLPEHLETWDEDQIASIVSNYADPYARFSMDTAPYNGKDFIVIRISPFDEIPVICKNDGHNNLRRGAIYTRTYRIPESSGVPSQTELREILEMATDIGVKKYIQRADRIGIKLVITKEILDDDKFESQKGDLT